MFVAAYRRARRRGSLTSAGAATRGPASCIHWGARGFVPARKSNAAPTPSPTAGWNSSALRCEPLILLGQAEADPDDVRARVDDLPGDRGVLVVGERPERRRERADDDAPAGSARAAAPAAARAHPGVEPNRKWRRPASWPASITSGIRSGPRHAARAAGAEPAHEPRHRRPVGEVQPRAVERAHHRVASAGRSRSRARRTGRSSRRRRCARGRAPRPVAVAQIADEVLDAEDRACPRRGDGAISQRG